MKVEQVATILNTIIGEVTGTTGIVTEDLSNIVSVGKEFTNILSENEAYDKYIGKLINHIGRVKFVDRVYNGQAPTVLMESWEFGSILEKIDCALPDAEWNKTWMLEDGAEYSQDIFKGPKDVDVQFFNDMVTFEIDMSFTDKQVKQSFSNAQQLFGFFNMVENRIRMRMTMDYDDLIMRTINNFIAATIQSEFDGDDELDTKTGAKAVNLLKLYKDTVPNANQGLEPETCLKDLEFIKFASYTLMLYSDRLEKPSKMFNIGGRIRFTPKEYQRIVLLSEFARAADVYLQSVTFHNELSRLPDAERVTYWQGSGTDYSFSNTSDIHVQIAGLTNGSAKLEINVNGVLGVMFDREALGVNNYNTRVTTHYNAKGEFTNNFYKSDARYFNDYKENFIVFYVA